jgi:hypothetical protein
MAELVTGALSCTLGSSGRPEYVSLAGEDGAAAWSFGESVSKLARINAHKAALLYDVGIAAVIVA